MYVDKGKVSILVLAKSATDGLDARDSKVTAKA